MTEQIPRQAGPETEPSKPGTGTSSLHLASGDDAIEAADRDDRLDAILTRGDVRDQAAERRDRRADRRPGGPGTVRQESIATGRAETVTRPQSTARSSWGCWKSANPNRYRP